MIMSLFRLAVTVFGPAASGDAHCDSDGRSLCMYLDRLGGVLAA